MTERFQRLAEQLDASIARLGERGAANAVDDGVSIRWAAVQQLRATISSIEGGSRGPFIHSLLRTPAHTDVVLRGDEPHHLRRALDELARQKSRNDQIDRGQIPGTLSGAEVTRLIRRHPQLFVGRPRKDPS